MNRSDILKLEAGQELDELVAERVMGLPILDLDTANCPYCGGEMWHGRERARCTSCSEWRYSPYKNYSDDIAAAWDVVEKMYEKYQGVSCSRVYTRWHAQMGTQIAEAETPMLAICRAALLAVSND
jgi:hypothetical protein